MKIKHLLNEDKTLDNTNETIEHSKLLQMTFTSPHQHLLLLRTFESIKIYRILSM